jgi:hypothetical protein
MPLLRLSSPVPANYLGAFQSRVPAAVMQQEHGLLYAYLPCRHTWSLAREILADLKYG